MRRTVLLLAAMATALLLVSGVAWAVTKDCRAGADFCVGTNEPDTLNGSEERDKIYGKAANDKLFGNGGNDRLAGGEDKDTIRGHAGEDSVSGQIQGADKIYGGPNDDYLSDDSWGCHADCVDDLNLLAGERGHDDLYGQNKLYGGPGNDYIQSGGFKETRTVLKGGSGFDRITGGASSDTIYAEDGEKDTVSCGGNDDTVYFDQGIDSVNPTNCEKRRGG